MRTLYVIIDDLSNAEIALKDGKRKDAMKQIKQAREKLCFMLYTAEFEVIDGLSQHPEGLSFRQWMKWKNL